MESLIVDGGGWSGQCTKVDKKSTGSFFYKYRYFLLTFSKKEEEAFVSTYNDLSSKVSNILGKHWPILKSTFSSIPEFQNPPLMAYCRSKNLKDLLVKNDIGKSHSFRLSDAGKKYQIRHYLNCDSDWVIYLVWCPCNLYYVGETTCTLKTRLNGHWYSIRKQRLDLPVSRHCTEKGLTEWDIKCMAIDWIPPPKRGGNRLTQLKRTELRWIFELGTLQPKGLNIKFKVNKDMIK